MNICEHLTATAQRIPHHEALVFEDRPFTYAQLNQLASDAAESLQAAGIQRGDRVAIMLPNVPAFVVWYFAALRKGAIAVSINTRLADKEVAFVVSDCEARVFVADQPTMVSIRNMLPDCVAAALETSELGDRHDGLAFAAAAPAPTSWVQTEPDEPAVILYTSGTTGFAKGATLSHNNVRSNVLEFNRLCNMQREDRILLAVPLFHCFGQNALLNSAFNAGATLVLQRKFDPHESTRLIADERVTQLYGVPTMFQLLHERCQPSDLATVNYCFSAAATLPIQVSRRWQEKFKMPIHEGYGLTETSPFASYNHQFRHVPGSIGTPIDSVAMKIVDTETGQICAPSELGEIVIRGPNVMLGYWNRPADTGQAIRDGWFHSGDIGRTDENGYFYIVDRAKDMISVGGTKVFPAEVERILSDHPGVSQVAVVGFPDEVFGEQVVAFVVPADVAPNQQLAAEIQQQAKQNLANYKVPKKVVFLKELPRNPSGKVLKTKLREMHIEAVTHYTGSKAVHATSMQQSKPTLRKQLESTHIAGRQRVANAFVQELVQAVTGCDKLPQPDCRFLDAGLDSLMIVEMSSHIQAELGPEEKASATLVFDYPRISDLADFLVEAIAPAKINPAEITRKKTTQGSSAQRTTSPSIRSPASRAAGKSDLREQIASLSEAEVLAELMQELED